MGKCLGQGWCKKAEECDLGHFKCLLHHGLSAAAPSRSRTRHLLPFITVAFVAGTCIKTAHPWRTGCQHSGPRPAMFKHSREWPGIWSCSIGSHHPELGAYYSGRSRTHVSSGPLSVETKILKGASQDSNPCCQSASWRLAHFAKRTDNNIMPHRYLTHQVSRYSMRPASYPASSRQGQHWRPECCSNCVVQVWTAAAASGRPPPAGTASDGPGPGQPDQLAVNRIVAL